MTERESESELESAPGDSDAPLLRAENLKKCFVSGGEFSARGVSARALNGVSLSIRRGEILCLVGESGCGKSTLARVLLGLARPDSGRVYFDGMRVDDLPERRRRKFRRRMQMVFQNPQASLNPRMTAGRALSEALRFHFPNLSSSETARRVDDALRDVGMDSSAASRRPHELSGGQRQRVSIARALIVEPDLVVADEPVAALDTSVRAQILNLLLDLRASRRLSYLFITHDLSVAERFGARVAVMYLGEVCETATRDELFSSPRHPYTRALLSAAPRIGAAQTFREGIGEPPSATRPPPGCAYAPRCPLARDKCRRESPTLQNDGPARATACHAVAEGWQ